jgi:hypothetical protein
MEMLKIRTPHPSLSPVGRGKESVSTNPNLYVAFPWRHQGDVRRVE